MILGFILGAIWQSFGIIWESFGSHLGVIWEPFGSHLGIIWETFRSQLGAIGEAFGGLEPEQASGRHLEVRSQKLQPLSFKM